MPEQFLYSYLESYLGGINSDLPPLKLPKDVAAWSTNCTLRGGFPKPRPARSRKPLTFPNAAMETFFLAGFFQGGGWYRPDFGQSQLIAAVSGRLFALVEIGGGFTVSEITVPGDPNLSTTNQVWMNQAEKWMIVTDGSDQLPIFYDGVSSRRSYGASVVLATTQAVGNFPTPRVIGEVITVTLTANYEGPLGVPVIFNGEFYQTLASGTGSSNNVILTNRTGTPGDSIPTGSDVVVRSSVLAIVTIGAIGVWGSPLTIGVSTTYGMTAGQIVSTSVNGAINSCGVTPPNIRFTIVSVDSDTQVTLRPLTIGNGGCGVGVGTLEIKAENPPGTQTQILGSSGGPDVILGQTDGAVMTPPVGGTVAATLNTAYTGPSGQSVWINNKQFSIAPSGGTGGNTLQLINLTDTADAGAAIPAEDILSVPELPAGRMGAYGLGHQAMSLIDGLSFLYGDTVGGPSGTPAHNYRDAVLKVTENTFLESAGSFRVPSSGEIITSITFTAILDAAYGQGPLEIGTSSRIFTCAVPADRQTWIALENPILTVALIGDGPLAQDSTILANSDTLFRSTEGLGSLIFARRNFETWGNTPISTEVNRTVEADDNSLLIWSSAVTFDNRFMHCALPRSTSSGIVHDAVLALNFDPVSSLRGKAPSIWESVWDGLPVLRIISGNFSGTKRCFMFAVEDSEIVLWEQLRTKSPIYYDNSTERITYTLESPCIFKPEERSDKIPMVRLTNGKIHIDQVRGEVDITVQWRPDFHAGWTDWITLHITDSTAPGYLTPLGLGEPPVGACDVPNNRPLQSGRFFQIRFIVNGQCVIMGAEFSAVPEPEIIFPAPNCGEITS